MKYLVFTWISLLMVMVATRPAAACSAAPLEEFSLDDDANSQGRPDAPGQVTFWVQRGKAPEQTGCSHMMTSCDDLGFISLQVPVQAEENTVEVGYRLALVGGQLPSGMSLPDYPIEARNGNIELTWLDGATDDQEDIGFQLAVIAVDRSGQESEPSVVLVEDDPYLGGCDQSQRTGIDPASALLVMAFLFGAVVRRRRSSAALG